MRQIAAGDIEPDRYRTGGQQQRAIAKPGSVREPDLVCLGVDRGHASREL